MLFNLLVYAAYMKITLYYGWRRIDSGRWCVLSGFSVTVRQGVKLFLFEPVGFLPMTAAEQGRCFVILGWKIISSAWKIRTPGLISLQGMKSSGNR